MPYFQESWTPILEVLNNKFKGSLRGLVVFEFKIKPAAWRRKTEKGSEKAVPFKLDMEVRKQTHARQMAAWQMWGGLQRVRKPRAFGKACPSFGKYLKEEKKGEKNEGKRKVTPFLLTQKLGQA